MTYNEPTTPHLTVEFCNQAFEITETAWPHIGPVKVHGADGTRTELPTLAEHIEDSADFARQHLEEFKADCAIIYGIDRIPVAFVTADEESEEWHDQDEWSV